MAKKINYADLYTLRKDGRYVGTYTDSTGKRHHVYDRDPKKLYYKIEEAQKPKELTFKDIAEAWHDEHWKQIGYKTQEAYTAPLRRIIEHYRNEQPEDITAAQIQAYIISLAKEGYSRRTVQMSLDILRMIYNKAILDGAVTVNPCDAVSIPRGLPTTKRTMPTDEELEKVKQSVSAPFGLFALFCLYTGARRGEALALKYEDIDRKAKVIHIRRSVEFEGNTPSIKSTKTEAGNRDVILLDALAEQLPKGKGLIFGNGEGGLLTKMQYRKRWQWYLDATGLHITAHQLRHGYATILYEAGIPDKDAQELLGHSNIAVTRNVYTHIRQSRKQETANKLNDFLSK